MTFENKGHTCDTPGCDEEAYSLGFCSACYAWAYAHKKESLAQTRQYVKKMERIQNRIDMMEKASKVRSISRKKRKAA